MKLLKLNKQGASVLEFIKQLPRMTWLYLRLVGRRFLQDGCQHSAAALTYMTLFAVVPVMTLMYSMFSLVPAFQGLGDQVRDLIFNNFVPSAGAEVQSYLDQFSSQARRLSFVGVGILVVTSYLMLLNIERVFNRIWATSGRRRGVISFLLYWAVLSLGPILIGATIAINTYLLTSKFFVEDSLAQEAVAAVLRYLPWILTMAAFTLLYMTVPNCKVQVRNALTGGIVATVAFELAKRSFGYYIANSAYSSIYGAFAVIPIFLLWVYLSWIIILAGAEFVRATENFSSDVNGQKMTRLTACVWVLWQFSQAQSLGIELRDSVVLKGGMSSTQWRQVRDILMRNQVVTVTDRGNYALLRSLENMSLYELKNWVIETYADSDLETLTEDAELPHWFANYSSRLEQMRQSELATMDISIAGLFNADFEDIEKQTDDKKT